MVFSILKRSKFIPTKCQKCNIRLVSLNLILSPKHLLSWQIFFRSIFWFQICFDDFQHYRKQKILCIEPERVTTNEKKLRYFSLGIPTALPLFFSAWEFPLNSMVNGRKKNCTCPFFLCSAAISIAGKLALIAFGDKCCETTNFHRTIRHTWEL